MDASEDFTQVQQRRVRRTVAELGTFHRVGLLCLCATDGAMTVFPVSAVRLALSEVFVFIIQT